MELNREFFAKEGARGGKQKGINYKKTRKALIDEVSKQVDKDMLNMIQSKFSNENIIKLLKSWEK